MLPPHPASSGGWCFAAQDVRPPVAPAAPAPPATPKAGANPSLNAVIKDGEGGSATVDIRVDKGKKSVTIEKSVTPQQGADATSADEDTGPDTPIVGIGSGKHGKRVRVGKIEI